jgi:hypothetical protein
MDFLFAVIVVVLFVLGLLVVIDGFSDRGRTPTGQDRRDKFPVVHPLIRDPFRTQDGDPSVESRHKTQIALGVALMLLAVVIAIVAI